MSSTAISNQPPQNESKSGKKKKSKAEVPARVSNAPSTTPSAEVGVEATATEATTNGVEGSYESPYMKELYKNIRNINKKLNATQKVDSIIAENPGKTLDELVASRKINNDQKAQALKKPSLQASLAQLEEQIAQYKKFDQEYQSRIAIEKAALETSHKEDLEKLKEATFAEAKMEANKEEKENMLVLSKFLRAAAAKRQNGDDTSIESRAFEGALLLVYGGDASAVVAMEKLIEGSGDKVPATDQELLDFTYDQVKQASLEHAPYAAEQAWVEDVAQSEPVPPSADGNRPPVETDPTILHAGLTELDNPQVAATDGDSHMETPTVPEASNIDAGAANAAAEVNWGAELSASAESGPDGWVEVPRDPAETDTGFDATPAAMNSTQSWAEDVPNEPAPVSSDPAAAQRTSNGGDGFHEVHH
ncbi:MAG: hypothetical protein M1830_001302, partial [Pleopsidium flavum]